MIFEFTQFGDYNNYEYLSEKDDSSWVQKVFYKSYIVFGRIVRPLFIDLVGPFVPFMSYFWVVRNEGDLECG